LLAAKNRFKIPSHFAGKQQIQQERPAKMVLPHIPARYLVIAIIKIHQDPFHAMKFLIARASKRFELHTSSNTHR
jgi:hypothetical protein